MHQEVNTWDVPGSSVDRVMRRRDAVGLAILVALGLTTSDAGRRLVDAAKKANKDKKDKKRKMDKGKSSQGASSSGREVVRVAQKYKGAKYTWGGASPK